MFDRPKLEHAPVSDPVAPSRKVSREGLVLIKSLEGFQPRAWRRPDGRWALGYGHTRSAREGLTVSEADAELLLQYDLLPVVATLNDRVSRPLNQHQFDALASFALSVGVEAFLGSDVLAALNAEGPEGAARALAAGTDVDPALARAGRRRHAEWALFGADPGTPVTVSALLAAPAPEVGPPTPVEVPAAPEVPAADPAGAEPSTGPAMAETAPETPEPTVADADAVPDAPPANPDLATPPDPVPAPVPRADAAVAPESPVAPVAEDPSAKAPKTATPPAFSLRYAAAVSHLLGEVPGRAAPATVVPAVAPTPEPQPAPAGALTPAPEAKPDDPAPAGLTTQARDATPPQATLPQAMLPQAAEPDPAAEPEPQADTAAAPPPPEVDREAVLAELMRRQMSPFAIQVHGPLPPLGRPTEPAAPAPAAPAPPRIRPQVAASGPMAAVLAGPLSLPPASTEAAPAPAAAPEPMGVDPAANAVATSPPIEVEPAPGLTLVLTPPPALERDVQRPVWSPDERHPQTRSLETDLFSEDELAADIGLGPVLRHEVIETPGHRFDFGQLGAYTGMGAVGLVSLGAAVPAAQALLDEGAGPSGETLLVFAALALIGAGCSGISGFNLWRLWREAHARDHAPRDA